MALEGPARYEGGRLSELRLETEVERIDAELELGRHASLVGELEALARVHPYHERLHAQLLLALYRSGRQAEALRAYGSFRRLLADELGLDPSPELRELEGRILRQDPGLAGPSLVSPRAAATDTAPARAAALPSGTVTLLFTDIAGSTALLRRLGPAYGEALAAHRRLLREAFTRYDGHEVDTQGDAFFFAFARASAAVDAAEAAQVALAGEGWPGRVRMGVHTGEPTQSGEGYVGLDVHLGARICAVAHGGQVLLSAATADLVPGRQLRDLGSHRLKDIEHPERLFQLGLEDFPPPRTGSPASLPVPANRLIGRNAELARALALLAREDVRLLTLTGPGGAGKSRLALEIAAAVAGERRDGVHLVRLAPLTDAALVPAAIAGAVGAREPTLSAVAELLAERAPLLLLDNVEHVADAAPLFGELLAAAPGLSLLTTSRSPLHLLGEHVLRVPPLDEDDAVALFLERAAAAGYTAPPSSLATVRELCRRVDRLPLAIELAAARVPLLGVETLLERLSLAVLGGGARDLPERQRTLRSTIDWSYALLAPRQRRLHECLAVFPGGCTLEAAEAVYEEDDFLGELAVLLDGSLLQTDDDRLGLPRIRLLETVREYALEHAAAAGRLDGLKRRQASWALGLAEEAEAGLSGAKQAVWLERLDVELPNIRAAVDWALASGEAEILLRLIAPLNRFWRAHGNAQEARGWLEQGLQAPGVADEVRANALWTVARQAMAQSDYRNALPRIEEALELFRALGRPREVVFALSELGWIALHRGELDRAEELVAEASELARASGDDRAVAAALDAAAAAAEGRGDLARARSLSEEVLELRRVAGDRLLIANAANNVGVTALAQGDLGRAREALHESLAISRELDDAIHTAAALCGLGEVAVCDGDLTAAGELLGASLVLYEELADERGRAECLYALGAVAAASDRPADAAGLWGAAAALRSRLGADLLPSELALRERFHDAVVIGLGEEAFATAFADGRHVPLKPLVLPSGQE
jgi:predicted ATPase/class 3 adenylate cyclase/Tfp pilus assembly protein PilF